MDMSSLESYDEHSPLLGTSPARGATTRPTRSRKAPSTLSNPDMEVDTQKVLRKRTLSVTSAAEDEDLNLVFILELYLLMNCPSRTLLCL